MLPETEVCCRQYTRMQCSAIQIYHVINFVDYDAYVGYAKRNRNAHSVLKLESSCLMRKHNLSGQARIRRARPLWSAIKHIVVHRGFLVDDMSCKGRGA